MRVRTLLAVALLAACAQAQKLPTQTRPGGGNRRAAATAAKSQMVGSSISLLVDRLKAVKDVPLRDATLDAIQNAQTCVRHRANLTDRDKESILTALEKAGLLDGPNQAGFPWQRKAGVFPPVLDDGTSCPHLPQPFGAAPGGVFGEHHSFPGGLAVHEANNQIAALNLANEYRQMYGVKAAGQPAVRIADDASTGVAINEDWLRAAPAWHDWAKIIVFQWNDDGTEFSELHFGGNGRTDNYGSAGDSRTGAHHILSLAESMSRGLPPGFVITQASAHASPTEGSEYKVVNWLRAAAILARIDAVKKGYLGIDQKGRLRLPAVRKLGSVDLPALGQVNVLAEYVLHNISDSDHLFSMAAASSVEILLRELARKFGFDSRDAARYNNEFRNPVLGCFSAERLYLIYSESGREGLQRELEKAHRESVF